MLLFKLPFLSGSPDPEEVPDPEPGNLESIISHGYSRGANCEYDFDPENATELAETVSDIYCGERLGKYTDSERSVYQSGWLFGYFTNRKQE